ncbi:uncharacterized protein LOC133530661 isoform X1 [Cydia pomonella]|uniref:uncharacterized protein LOC133530661 isoform X1 n=1 Tax=Cydia pomonella TaxID=82600 RepID=UPI002ADDDCB0|nr:uncharacterized protein LOC133530661 isoform X1 [Cydia pomonella]
MVVPGQDSSATIKDNLEKKPEGEKSDTETNEKVKLKTETDLPPTELERLKTFTQQVARCAAKSFCETYVRPLVIKNPNPLPSKSETINIRNQNSSATIINPAEDQTETILNPKQENKEEQVLSIQKQRRETEEESYKKAAVVNPNRTEDPIAATVNLLQEKEMVILDKEKPSLSFDIANILSYLPCKSLFASSDEKDENSDEALNLESKPSELSGPFEINCGGSQSRTSQETKDDEEIDKDTIEEASPFTEEDQ